MILRVYRGLRRSSLRARPGPTSNGPTSACSCPGSSRSAAYLAGVGTTFTSSRTIVGTDTVVVETNADYVEGDETSSVSSGDRYDVVDGKITVITSYAVEL